MTENAPIGVVTGMVFEAAIVNRWQAASDTAAPMVEIAGADPAKARAGARALLDRGASALVSFGVAGALDPALTAGTLVLPARIVGDDGTEFATDPAWNDRLASSLHSLVTVANADLAGVSLPVLSALHKRELSASTRTGAVDMESHAVAAVAGSENVPFIAIRAIADEAEQDLPKAVLNAIREDGTINASSLALNLLTSPQQLPALIRLGRQNATAKRTLGRIARKVMPGFCRY